MFAETQASSPVGANSAAGVNGAPGSAAHAASDASHATAEQENPSQQEQPAPLEAANVPGFVEGVQAMFSGQWQQALAYFGQAFIACRDAGAAQLRCQVAHYAVAVSILEAYGAVDQAAAARLSRYAAGLPLLMLDHSSFLLNDAISRNLRAGNFTWCAKRLEQFGHHCMAIGRPDLAQGVGMRLQQVVATGVGDASVAPGESAEALARSVEGAISMQEIAGAVSRLKAGMF
jgi:hypothetical protein